MPSAAFTPPAVPTSLARSRASRKGAARAARRAVRRPTTAVLATGRVGAPATTTGAVDSLQCDAELARAVAAGAVVVLKLHSRSCRACIGVAPRFRKMARAYVGRARFVEMELTASRDMAAELGVQALPFFALYNAGRLVAAEPLALPRISRLGDRVDSLLKEV